MNEHATPRAELRCIRRLTISPESAQIDLHPATPGAVYQQTARWRTPCLAGQRSLTLSEKSAVWCGTTPSAGQLLYRTRHGGTRRARAPRVEWRGVAWPGVPGTPLARPSARPPSFPCPLRSLVSEGVGCTRRTHKRERQPEKKSQRFGPSKPSTTTTATATITATATATAAAGRRSCHHRKLNNP